MPKLTKDQKAFRKEMKREFAAMGGKLFSFEKLGVTVALWRTGSEMGRYAVAIQSPSEDKFSRKFGEFTVLARVLEDGMYMPVVLGRAIDSIFDDETFNRAVANDIADAIGVYR